MDKRNGMVIGALAALGASVAGQVTAAALRPPGPLEIALFAVLEIVFSVLAAYALAGRAAERGYLQHKKRVGFSTLMRLREASDTLDRLQATVQRKKAALGRGGRLDPSLTIEYFDHVLSITDELKGTVLAAREDWLEVFGEDLREARAIEALARQKEAELLALERRLREMKSAEERGRAIEAYEQRVRLLDERIERLRAEVPLTVQALAPQFRDLVSPREKAREPFRLPGFQPPAPRTEAAVSSPPGQPVRGRGRIRKRGKDDARQPVAAGVNGQVS